MDQQVIDEGKTMAVISYLTFIGLLIAFVVNNERNNAFTKFHIGQSLRVVILVFVNFVIGRILPNSLGYIHGVVGLCIFGLAILGIVNAVNGRSQKLPVIGSIGDQ
ncbi:hypothetical protein K8352_14730 [Flavobacteriaceae bacterium F89]|uniref:Uncharacterized protein n=1 Tax=Cerina litoralis TaxID=2874477 RepID=A0AAE3EVX1_9FLAO|nr:hypothetical protein [Cerina litoralis]MCG2462012.1 hypothetical protein [Cerina litoralis]